VHFYEVGGLLIRRWVPAQRRKMMEVWSGAAWSPFPDVDRLVRHGRRLTEAQALSLLVNAAETAEASRRFSDDEEARAALHARVRRA
jgi:hypothetical protein